MTDRITLFHSGVGDFDDCLVKNAYEVLVHESVRWLPFLVGTKLVQKTVYPRQNFVYNVGAKGHRVITNGNQIVNYVITEYKKRVVEFNVQASLSRPHEFTYTITVTYSDYTTTTHSWNSSVLKESGNTRLSNDTIATMMSPYLDPGKTVSTYSISSPDYRITASLLNFDGTQPTQGNIDSGNVYPFALTSKNTFWSCNKNFSDIIVNEDVVNSIAYAYDTVRDVYGMPILSAALSSIDKRTFTCLTHSEPQVVALLGQFIPVADDGTPWYEDFDENGDGVIDGDYPSIHYIITNLTADSDVDVRLEGSTGSGPWIYDSIPGPDFDFKGITVQVPENSNNLLVHEQQSINVSYGIVSQVQITATMENVFMRVEKVGGDAWDNAVLYWSGKQGSGSYNPPNLMLTDLATDTLYCEIPSLESYDELWISEYLSFTGWCNGGGSGYDKLDIYFDVPQIEIPGDVIFDGYVFQKVSVNGEQSGVSFDALQLTFNSGKMLASSNYSEVITVEEEGARVPIGDPDDPRYQVYGLIIDEVMIGEFPKVVDPDVPPPYHYEVISYNPSIEMRVDDVTDPNKCLVYAKRRGGNLDKWNPYIHRGYFYFNDEEYYLHASQTKLPMIGHPFNGTVQDGTIITLSNMQADGAPIIVIKRVNGQVVKQYRQVPKSKPPLHPLDVVDDLVGNGLNVIYASYKDIYDVRVEIDGVQVSNFSVSGNAITLNDGSIFTKSRPVKLIYKLIDSFAIERGSDWTNLYFGAQDDNIEIYYETVSSNPYYPATNVILNPIYTNVHTGFLFIDDSEPIAYRFDAYITPRRLPADGYSEGRIIVTIRDVYYNPVPNYDVTISGNNLVIVLDNGSYQITNGVALKTNSCGQCSVIFRSSSTPGIVQYIITTGIKIETINVEIYEV